MMSRSYPAGDLDRCILYSLFDILGMVNLGGPLEKMVWGEGKPTFAYWTSLIALESKTSGRGGPGQMSFEIKGGVDLPSLSCFDT